MRNLFLALLLANLLFLGWRYWVAPPEVPASELVAAGSEPKIEALVDPTSGAQGRGAATASGGAARLSAARDGRCMRIGPITEGLAADKLRARLAAQGFSATTSAEEGQVWVGHWVQLESVASREEADRLVARLAAGGLPDAYVVLQAAPPFAISLGVFRDRERAEAVARQATRMGFRPRTTDRYRTGMQYWLSVVVPKGQELPMEALGQESGQILRAERANCPAEAVGSPTED